MLAIAVLSFALPTVSPTMAQDERPEAAEMPEALVAGVDELSLGYPELLEIEWAEYSDGGIVAWLPDIFYLQPLQELRESADEEAAHDPEDYAMQFLALDTVNADDDYTMLIYVTRFPWSSRYNSSALEMAHLTALVSSPEFERQLEPVEYNLEGYDAAYTEDVVTTEEGKTIVMAYFIIDTDFFYTVNFAMPPETQEINRVVFELAIKTMTFELDDEES
ncbi:MAG: hypothetical protein OXG78_01700 [Chloroflexi bacterium]|nr:hypothetical protein [Chloroflexota bacterium]